MIKNTFSVLLADNDIKRRPGILYTKYKNYVLIKGYFTDNYTDIAHISDINKALPYKDWMSDLIKLMIVKWEIEWDSEDGLELPDIPLFLRT
tara:strand:+ start:1434 stop:1709 length:276 start_codon:yes stop_codon:yes gene_type:complete